MLPTLWVSEDMQVNFEEGESSPMSKPLGDSPTEGVKVIEQPKDIVGKTAFEASFHKPDTQPARCLVKSLHTKCRPSIVFPSSGLCSAVSFF
jgi:hypothetical protein